MSIAARVRISGPLVRYVEGFAAELKAQGYTDLSAANQLRLMADFSGWLDRKGLAIGDIDRGVVDRFLAKRRRTHTAFISERAMTPLLQHLHSAGAVTVSAPDVRPRRGVLADYERYLIEETGVGPAHVTLCLTIADEFLDGRRVARLQPADVTRFIDAHAGQPGLAGCLSALRSLLRYLFASSKTALDLVHAVPRTPRWRQKSLPQALDSRELRSVLATCDRRSAVGRRDHAVLLLLSRLGLRAGEVARLELDAIDWRAGELTILGKGGSVGRLPLPADVGEAIATYLQRAVRSRSTRAVFVSSHAPYGALRPGAIIQIARTALRSAGIPRGGAHRFRHTVATQMLRAGASSTEIAQVLRHRHLDTTAIYAKVDSDSLRTIAKPWPVDDPDRELVRALAQRWPGGVP